MLIDLGRVKIRNFEWEDIPSIAKYANNIRVAETLRNRFPHPYTEEHARSWLQHCHDDPDPTHFALSLGEGAIGSIGLQFLDDVYCTTVELGYWVGEPFWGQGIASQAVAGFVPFVFEQFDIERIQAEVFESNPASARVLEKAGFRREAHFRNSIYKNGRLMDSWIYAILREDIAGGA